MDQHLGHADRIDLDRVGGLYRTYADDLNRVREKHRELLGPPASLKDQLDDITTG